MITGAAAEASSKERRQHALIAIDMLVAGSMMRNIVTHLLSIDEPSFERVKTMCVSLGEVLVRPLAEALSIEERGGTRERLTAILIAFGPAGRRTIERLKTSPNPAVRRTAIHLMRQFGGVDSLPDLTDLLNDSDSMIQREAVRAILNIGTEKAYRVLEEALATGTERSRDAIMLAISMHARRTRDAPLRLHRPPRRSPPPHRHLPARHRIAGRAARPRGHRAAHRSARQGRMVGAPAHGGASCGVGCRAGTDRHARSVQRARERPPTGRGASAAVARPFLERRGRAGGRTT